MTNSFNWQAVIRDGMDARGVSLYGCADPVATRLGAATMSTHSRMAYAMKTGRIEVGLLDAWMATLGLRLTVRVEG